MSGKAAMTQCIKGGGVPFTRPVSEVPPGGYETTTLDGAVGEVCGGVLGVGV